MSNVSMSAPQEEMNSIANGDDFIGQSGAIKRVRALISLVAPHDTPVLILGETGTGKELAARKIHNMSTRSANSFIAFNSCCFQDTMLESELFGYKKGAFTGADRDKEGLLEIADHGTLFLDEIGDMSSAVQAKLLRVIETGTFRKLGDTKELKVDVRFVFATNKELSSHAEKGKFRKDLFYRINTITLDLPPLREKKEDIPLLVDYFFQKFKRQDERKHFDEEAFQRLIAYDWPGNVRELANVVESAVLVSGGRETINSVDLPDRLSQALPPPPIGLGKPKPSVELVPLVEAENRHIEMVLKLVRGNKTEAARLLGISRKGLYDRLRRTKVATIQL